MKKTGRPDKKREGVKRSNRRTAIYRKTLNLFAKKGYSATSMSMVSRNLGMSKATLYYYCSSKENLLHQIYLDYLQRHLIPIIDEAEKVAAPKDRIAFFLRELTLLNASSKSGRVLIQETHNLNRRHRDEITFTFRRAYDLLGNAVKELEQSRGGRKFRESFLTFMGLSMANWIVYWFDYSLQGNAEELAETVVQIFLNGLLHYE